MRDGIRVFEDQAFLRAIYRAALAVTVLGVVLGALWFGLLRPLVPGIAPTELAAMGSFDAWIPWLLGMALVLALAFMAHEGVHAIFFKLYAPQGARVGFGANWKLGMLYACADGIEYTRRQYQSIIAAPSVLVTAVLLALGACLGYPVAGYALAVLHLSGCTGDWGYLVEIARDPSITGCEDTEWGVRFLRAEDMRDADASGGPHG